jgi:polyisoprenoid-binding protein YceI
MKTQRFSFSISIALGLFIASAALAAAETWTPANLDMVHSRLSFTASTVLFDVEGRYTNFKLLVAGEATQPETLKVKLEVAANSINTDNAKRDEHLKGPDFFDVAKYPTVRFESTKVEQQGKNLTVTGVLDMHGKQQTVTIPFKVAQGKNGAGVDTISYKGKLVLDRTRFGIGTDSVAAKISLEKDVELGLLIVTFAKR